MGFMKPKVPAAPAVEYPDPPPTEVDENIIKARLSARRRRATRVGRQGTIMTRPLGLDSVASTMLGS